MCQQAQAQACHCLEILEIRTLSIRIKENPPQALAVAGSTSFIK